MINIRKAHRSDIPLIAPLFDQYRIFYNQTSDIEGAKKFLEKRMQKGDSIIFVAFSNNEAVGFMQLFTSFSSVSMQPLFILNDLYVIASQRGKGIGKSLLMAAKDHCKEKKYKGLALETNKDNPAQHLYEKLNWKKDTDCFHYFWTSK